MEFFVEKWNRRFSTIPIKKKRYLKDFHLILIMKSSSWCEFDGWYGVSAILIAYSLISLNLIDSSNIIYILLNLTGAIGILYHSYKKKDYQPVILNIIWALIALITLARLFL